MSPEQAIGLIPIGGGGVLGGVDKVEEEETYYDEETEITTMTMMILTKVRFARVRLNTNSVYTVSQYIDECLYSLLVLTPALI